MWRRLKAWLESPQVFPRATAGGEADGQPRSAADYPSVFDQLSPDELHEDTEELTEEAIFEDLFQPQSRDHHFLGFYSEQGGRLAMERYGFFKLLRQKGFDPQLGVDLTDPQRHQLLFYDGARDPEHLLIKLEAGFRDLELAHGEKCRMLFIYWLMMQDPRRNFASDRPRLPDQRHPGLGLFLYFGHLLKLMTVRLHCDGLMNHPAHFHNAVLYGKVMHFVDPEVEGRFQALRRDLRGVDLAVATRAVDEGRVIDAAGRALRWEGSPQVMPITLQVLTWFDSPGYQETVARTREENRFEIVAAAGSGG